MTENATTTTQKKVSEADKIWQEIRGLAINVYSLDGQKVSDHVLKIDLPANELYVKLKSSAVLPALEAALGKKYEVELAEQYVIVRRAVVDDEVVLNALQKTLEKMAEKR